MVAFVEPWSSVEQCLHHTQYFPVSSGAFITKESCPTLGLICPGILSLPSNLSLNVCFCVYVFSHKSTVMGLPIYLHEGTWLPTMAVSQYTAFGYRLFFLMTIVQFYCHDIYSILNSLHKHLKCNCESNK